MMVQQEYATAADVGICCHLFTAVQPHDRVYHSQWRVGTAIVVLLLLQPNNLQLRRM